ncbi:MAG: 50S ribosomal protein L10 [Clostridiales Family XIII bacterium]|jgi:large subunit ribosomal protein L10|nr:50S ribosomal protein L10 [Clostridiales Family XIII bacterium]
MPSAEHLKEKQAVIDEIKDKFGKAQSAIVIDYIGISVAEADVMRKKLREAEVDYKVYKNTLVKRAIEGTGYAALSDALAGPSAIAFGFEDAVAPARVLNGIFKDFKKMEFKAGIIEGTFFNMESLKEVAMLPTKGELIGRFLGSIQSPISTLTRTFKAIADAMEDGTLASAKPADEAAAPAAEAAPEAEAAAPAAEAAKPAEAEAAPAEAAKPAKAEAAPAEAEAAPAAADSTGETAKTE